MQQFARIRTGTRVVPVLLDGDTLLDLSSVVPDITPETIADGSLAKVKPAGLSPVQGAVTHLPPISGLRQIPATGYNYKKHIEEMKVPTPTEPELFLKSVFSLTGPFDPVSRGPNPGTKLDWETELGVVIGRDTIDITAAQAPDHIFGFVCVNDISDRATQIDSAGVQHLDRAKSRPTYCPVGPYLTTGIDGMNVDLWTKVNGKFEQQGNTSDMLFNIFEMVAYFSKHLRMVPGDIVSTGTPPGVGMGKNRFMNPGDVLECGITHLGSQRHEIVP